MRAGFVTAMVYVAVRLLQDFGDTPWTTGIAVILIVFAAFLLIEQVLIDHDKDGKR